MSRVGCLTVAWIAWALSAAAFGQEANPPKAESNVSGRGHIRVGCTTCHSVHQAQGKILFALEANKKAINPATKKPFEGVSALCLACHAEPEQGGAGMLPVSASHSHPMGRESNPKVAGVKEEFLRDGKLECIGCHDPHESNPNWALLRIDTKKGTDMDTFCAMCHASKADPSTVAAVSKTPVFNSMDETKASAASPAAPAAAPAKPAVPPTLPEKTPAKTPGK